MSKTDKTKPYRIRKAQGERPKGKGYVEMVHFYFGRPKAWRDTVKLRHGADRAALRDQLRAARQDPDSDVQEPGPTGTAWDVY